MMPLAVWFRRNGQLPVAGVTVFLFVLVVGYAYYDLHRERELRRRTLAEISNLISASITQQNRTFAEILLESIRARLGAVKAEVTIENEAILASSGTFSNESSRFVREVAKVPGPKQMALIAYFSRLTELRAYLFALSVVLAAFFVSHTMIKRLEHRFTEDVILPLQKFKFSEAALKIAEFEKIRSLQNDAAELATERAVTQAMILRDKQIAHDIRSPLSALTVLATLMPQVKENERLLFKRAVESIKAITNKLDEKLLLSSFGDETARGSMCASVTYPLGPLIEMCLSQAQTQWRGKHGLEFSFNPDSGFGIFVGVDPMELRRAVSNILNNAVEAIEHRYGMVSVSFKIHANTLNVDVIDNGKGIPPNRINLLGNLGASFEKEGGSGLGLHHAKKLLTTHGGGINISSEPGKGTKVSLSIPTANPPEWFRESISLYDVDTVIVVDNDESIHELWRHRLLSIPKFSKSIHVMSGSQFDEILQRKTSLQAENKLFLVDHDLGRNSTSGLELIRRHKITSQSILMTSHFWETDVQDNCKALGLKILPKNWIGSIPIIA